MGDPNQDTLDEALAELASFGPDLRNGNTNHAPMAVEALCVLGRHDAVFPFVSRYRAELLPMPPTGERIDSAHWRAALAKPERAGDWSAFFADELAGAPWREVLDRWAGRLAPGLSAAATHGVIRVGHATRGLAARESPVRLRELADALGSWACTYQELPTARGGASLGLAPEAAFARVPIQPREQRRFRGSIVSALAGLDDFPEFAPVIDLVDVSGDANALLAELTRLFARVYAANAHDPLTSIVFIHGITSATALGHLLPHLSGANARAALRYAWQASCALYATFGRAAPAREVAPPRASLQELAERAVAHGDEHAIKLAEACLARHALAPDPAYLAAIESAVTLLPRAT
jgi:hypothetical protein